MNKIEKLEKAIAVDLQSEIEHGIYVSNLAYLLSKEVGLSEEQSYEVAVAGVLHDIGKVRLTNYLYGDDNQSAVRQMRYVRLHSTQGYDILKDKGYSDFILETVLHHHENYDGSGYPDNLEGKNIPIGARILRVCDVFIALISDRPYRRAFDEKVAIELMIDEVKNFDMEVFLAFQRVVNSIDISKDIKKEMINIMEEKNGTY